jgi:two-component system response regulator AtoC
MQEMFDIIETVGPSDATVLITGESGTGKELAAQALHRNSPRCSRPLVKLSCAALPENLLEDELFGHERGAFTDAKERKPGRFEMADGGSIFLDDIDDMSLRTQVKLLRVLQEREFERLGGTKTVRVDVRVIVATKVDLSHLVKQGRFRDDLYFRLRVVELHLPPLRERPGDLPLLVHYFTQRHAPNRNFAVSPETLQEMAAYSWPGNVRELENAVLRAIAMAGTSEVLSDKHLLARPASLRSGMHAPVPLVGGTMLAPEAPPPAAPSTPSGPPSAAAPAVKQSAPGPAVPLRDVVAKAEREHILAVLAYANGNKTRAAALLDISRKNLWEKMRDYGLQGEKDE